MLSGIPDHRKKCMVLQEQQGLSKWPNESSVVGMLLLPGEICLYPFAEKKNALQAYFSRSAATYCMFKNMAQIPVYFNCFAHTTNLRLTLNQMLYHPGKICIMLA